MNAASANAARLVSDAQTLFTAGRLPSAAALAVLSIEEAGKVSLLRWVAVAEGDQELRDAWHAYRSHTMKNVAWIVPMLVAKGARTLDDFAPVVDDRSDHAAVLDQVKQIALYTDCLAKRHWSEPHAVIDAPLVETLIQTATLLAKDRRYTAMEIELWIKHLKPVWKRGAAWMKKALANWHKEMIERGLSQDDLADTERFIWGDPRS